jgi:hypothetical protein
MQSPSVPAQIIISIIPIVGIVMGSVVVFFYLLWTHRERKLMIQMGSYVPFHLDLGVFSLLAGLLLTSIGGVLSLFIGLLSGITWGLLGGLLPLAIGIGLLVYNRLGSRSEAS